MADKTQKYPDNAEGAFYVDNTCIDCDACRQIAPDNFTRNEEAGYTFVSKQPENEQEAEQCLEAMEGCPVESIGNDGP
jgi:ferredoxin